MGLRFGNIAVDILRRTVIDILPDLCPHAFPSRS
jgi:hypothetical protein